MGCVFGKAISSSGPPSDDIVVGKGRGKGDEKDFSVPSGRKEKVVVGSVNKAEEQSGGGGGQTQNGGDQKEEDQKDENARRARGERRRSKPNPRLSNPPKHIHGEQVAAGWPSWLSAVAGEAINGWQAAQLSGIWLNTPAVTLAGNLLHCRRSPSATLSAVHTSTSSPTIQIVGGKNLGWNGLQSSKLGSTLDIDIEEFDWIELDADLYHWTKALRPVQWYPGHIAKTEKELKDQLKLMDVVIEVRDARIPMSTSHPQMDSWLGNRKRIIVLNREDMISTADRNAWASYYARQGTKVVFSNGQLGMGTMKLNRLAKALAGGVNIKRKAKGLLPRPVRAGIIGYPNVGKSSLINRLLKRRMCPAAPRPGVTRELKWVRFGKDLELLDSPGIIPMRINDQSAAIKLAICDDIGERSYDVTEVAAILVQMLARLPAVGNIALRDRYKIETDGRVGRIFIQKLALQLFNGDTHQAAFRVLSDFRKGKFGWVALERPPR